MSSTILVLEVVRFPVIRVALRLVVFVVGGVETLRRKVFELIELVFLFYILFFLIGEILVSKARRRKVKKNVMADYKKIKL